MHVSDAYANARARRRPTANDGACARLSGYQMADADRCGLYLAPQRKKCLEMYTSGGTGRDDGSVGVGRMCRSILVTIKDFFVNIEKNPSQVYLIIYSLRPLIT